MGLLFASGQAPAPAVRRVTVRRAAGIQVGPACTHEATTDTVVEQVHERARPTRLPGHRGDPVSCYKPHGVRYPARREWLIDAMNVVGSRPTGWWRDRAAALRELHSRVRNIAASRGQPVTLVVDGRALPDLPAGECDGVRVEYAPGGRDAADERIVELVAAASDPAAVTVVTSDRALAARVRRMGAAVQGAGAWLRCAGG